MAQKQMTAESNVEFRSMTTSLECGANKTGLRQSAVDKLIHSLSLHFFEKRGPLLESSGTTCCLPTLSHPRTSPYSIKLAHFIL